MALLHMSSSRFPHLRPLFPAISTPTTNHPQKPSRRLSSTQTQSPTPSSPGPLRRCLRCGRLYDPDSNSPTACSFHGHVTGDKGLFALAPPHQGIDGEWSDRSGVIVYRWNDEDHRPNTGRANWKGRWSCCAEYGEDAPPCRRGWHVSYDEGFTMF